MKLLLKSIFSLIGIAVLAIGFGTINVSAETSGETSGTVKSIREEIQNIREEQQMTVKNEVQAGKTNIEAIKDTVKTTKTSEKALVQNLRDVKNSATSTALRLEISNQIRERLQLLKDLSTTTKKQIEDERESVRKRVEAIRTATEAKIRAQKTAIKETLQEGAVERIRTHIGKIVTNLNHRLEILTGIANKINSRITKLETQNLDQSEAKTQLNNALSQIEQIRNKIPSITTASDEALKTDLPKSTLEVAKTQAKEIEALIKTARETLVKALTSIQNSLGENPVTNENQ